MTLRLPKPNLSALKRFAWPFMLLALGLGVYELSRYMLPYADRPIAKVSVQGDLSYVNQTSLRERLEPYSAATFFSVDLAGIRHELEQMPWIAHAEVRRVWPDQVVVKLEEQLPVARWGNEALLNNQGKAFVPRDLAEYANLPQLSGPQRAQRRIMQQYQLFNQMLRPMGLSISSLELRERGSWFLKTHQGMEILLGRDRLLEKIKRFSTIYEKALKEQNQNIARIDLRYPNGLAVAWHDPVAPDAAAATAVVQ